MNEAELKTFCREHAGEDMPPEAIALLARDPELRREVDQLIMVQRLMSLKTYEAPGPGSADRCIRAVQARIESREKLSLLETIRSWFTYDTPSPSFVYAAATLAVCVLGASMWIQSSGANKNVLVESTPDPVLSPVALTTPVETNQQQMAATPPVTEKPIIMLRVNSDAITEAPGRGLTFGGDESVPVSYEP